MILALQPPLKGPVPAPLPAVSCDAALARLFAPPRPVMGRYEICTTSASIEDIVAAGGPVYGDVEAIGPLDAFGTAGSYERSALSRLYGGTRPRVVRGWQEDGDRFVSSTLISPYPDPTLTRLIAGTMEIRWTTTRPADHHGTTKNTKDTKN
jgi:hypothetical protein